MNNRSAALGVLAMAATAFLWSIAGLFIKVIDWHPLTIAGGAVILVAVTAAPEKGPSARRRGCP